MIALVSALLITGAASLLVPRFSFLFIWVLLLASVRMPLLALIAALVIGLFFDIVHVMPLGQMGLFFLGAVSLFELYSTVFYNRNLLFMNMYALVFTAFSFILLEEQVTVGAVVVYLISAVAVSIILAPRRVVSSVG